MNLQDLCHPMLSSDSLKWRCQILNQAKQSKAKQSVLLIYHPRVLRKPFLTTAFLGPLLRFSFFGAPVKQGYNMNRWTDEWFFSICAPLQMCQGWLRTLLWAAYNLIMQATHCSPSPRELGTQFSDLEWMEGWVNLGLHEPVGIKLRLGWSLCCSTAV